MAGDCESDAFQASPALFVRRRYRVNNDTTSTADTRSLPSYAVVFSEVDDTVAPVLIAAGFVRVRRQVFLC